MRVDRFAWARTWTRLDMRASPAGEEQPDTRPLAAWADRRCLVLLGESGVGKSTELADESRRLHDAGQVAVLADLGATTDRTDLAARMLPSPPVGEAVLLIDGFDEVFADVADIADVLATYLDTIDPARVALRIASRPAVWSTRLQNQLVGRWPDTTVLVLDPPSRNDIHVAATASLDHARAKVFMEAVGARDLWTLASSPIALDFLLSSFAADNDIAGNRLEIYRDGLARLVSERHDRRVDRGRTGATAAARLQAASTIAFLSMFAGRPTISTRPLPRGDMLDLDEIAGIDGYPLTTLRDVAQSAAFRPAGIEAVSWAHRSYAEFLAAERIRDLPLATLLSMLGQPTSPDRIAPPVAQIASWVASTRSDLFDWLVDHDLDVLLDANLPDATTEQRGRVAEAVVDAILGGRGFDWRGTALSSLAHDQLARSLRRHLTDDTVAPEAKAELLHVASQTGAVGIDDVLLEIIEAAASHDDYDEIVSLGRWAVIALKSGSDAATSDRLAALARDPGTNRWIRADLLEGLHPERIDSVSLLDLLPDDVFAGFDSTFLGLVSRVRELAISDRETLLALLDWLARQREDSHHDHFFGEALDDASSAAVASIPDEEVAEAFIRLLVRHAEHTVTARIPPELRDVDRNERRSLMARVALAAADSPTVVWVIGYALVDSGDFDHYVDLAAAEGGLHPTGEHWTIAAANVALMSAGADALEPIVDSAMRRHPTATEALESLWGATWRARRSEALHSATESEARQAGSRARNTFDRAELDEAVASADWARAAASMHRPVEDSSAGQVHPRRLSRGSAWRSLDADVQQRIADLAASAAVSTPPTDLRTRHAIADAIGLVADVDATRLDGMPGARWIELVDPMLDSAEDPDVCSLVVERASDADGVAVEAIATAHVRADATAHHTMTLDRLGNYRPDQLEMTLRDLVAAPATTDAPTATILADLFARRVAGAASLALEVIAARPQSRPAKLDAAAGAVVVNLDDDSSAGRTIRMWRRAVAAAGALFVAPPDTVEGVDIVAVVTADWAFTQDVARRLGGHHATLFPSLDPQQLADIYLWVDSRLVRRQYAPGRVYDIDSVQDLPNTILQTIGGRQDDAAAVALRRIAGHRSSVGIRDYADQVQRAADTSNWRPIPIEELRALVDDAERRIVTTPAQLVLVVREAIEDYAKVVRNDAAIRRRLWFPTDDGDSPRSEEVASDELRVELEQRLKRRVAVHREVRIEPRVGDQSASDVDLLVTVFDKDRVLSCIVEVKANWFQNLVARIATQLVDRYLAGPVTEAGIFVVFWFAAANWAPSDPRLKKALKDKKRFEARLAVAMQPHADAPVHAVVVDCTLEQHR